MRAVRRRQSPGDAGAGELCCLTVPAGMSVDRRVVAESLASEVHDEAEGEEDRAGIGTASVALMGSGSGSSSDPEESTADGGDLGGGGGGDEAPVGISTSTMGTAITLCVVLCISPSAHEPDRDKWGRPGRPRTRIA